MRTSAPLPDDHANDDRSLRAPSLRIQSRCLALLLAIPLLLAAPLVGATVLEEESSAHEAPTWSPEHSLAFRSIGGITLSGDGALVAYTVREALTEGETSEYRTQIHVAATDGSWDRQYTRGGHSASSPAFSPDGAWLAFTRRGDGKEAKTQIWRMRVAGGEATQVTGLDSGVSSFAWSPDGTHLAVLSSDPETEEEKERRKEKRDPILVDQNHKFAHLYLVDVAAATAPADPAATESYEPRRLTEGSFHITSFDWSPDGGTIVFAHQPDPLINTGMVEGDLSLVDVETGDVTPFMEGRGVDRSPRYSPDGRFIAWVGTGAKAEPVGLGDIHVKAANGQGGIWEPDRTPDRSSSLVAWTPGSRAVLVSESVGTTRQLIEVPMEGEEVRIVTTNDGQPMQGVAGSPALSADGSTVAFTWETPDQPEELYVASTAGFGTDLAPRRISSVNVDVPLPPMGRTEVVSWTSGDGTPVEGLITYPVGYAEGDTVPLVLNVHGGPAGVFSQSFTGGPSIYLLQHFAEQGYAILRPNPRGSTGYGKDFRFANIRDWGYGDYEDLMSGVDWAVEAGIADPERLYLMGWSYGGYMTSFAITRTDRFRAASMGAGLPNLVSMVHTTDIPDYLAAHQGAELWEDIEEYERHSAMYHLDKVTTPTQILHGENDLRVPFDQGRELYLGLQRLGVPTEMVAYPRTPHGPREPKLLIDVTPRIIDWFERHTPGGEPQEGDGETPTSSSEPR